jgi:hypothetical protein
MTETLSSEELEIGRQIRVLADLGAPIRDANAVVWTAVNRSPRRGLLRLPMALAAFVSVLAVVAVVGLVSIDYADSSPVTAQVGGFNFGEINLGGTTYDISVARSMDLSRARLTELGEARQNSGFRTEGSTVYQVDDVDPRLVLVMKLIPGEHDDAGSIGAYLVLVRGDGFSLLCPYFQVSDPLAPSVCQ